MPFDQATYPFGQSAAVAPADRADFEALKESILSELNPYTLVQAIFVDEFLHASWELTRARKYGASQHYINRANRNWHRARKTLNRLCTSHVAALNLLEGDDAGAAEACPLANPLAIAKRGRPSAAYRWSIADEKKQLAELRNQ